MAQPPSVCRQVRRETDYAGGRPKRLALRARDQCQASSRPQSLPAMPIGCDPTEGRTRCLVAWTRRGESPLAGGRSVWASMATASLRLSTREAPRRRRDPAHAAAGVGPDDGSNGFGRGLPHVPGLHDLSRRTRSKSPSPRSSRPSELSGIAIPPALERDGRPTHARPCSSTESCSAPATSRISASVSLVEKGSARVLEATRSVTGKSPGL